MSYTSLNLKTSVLESDDALNFKVWDDSTGWNDEQYTTWGAKLTLIHETYGTKTMNIIEGVDRTKFDEYLSDDGLEVSLADLGIDDDFFTDGYYQVIVELTNDDWVTSKEYTNRQAFLAHSRCMARKIGGKLNDIDLLNNTKELQCFIENFEAYTLFMLFSGAEDQISEGRLTEFSNTMDLINDLFTKYEIEECF